jgi:stearoyl-CoA desaturase (delta-9 desaturase)
VCAFLSVYNLFGSPLGIAATHVTHHKHSDKEKDPHPASHPLQSWFWVYPKFETSSDVATVKRLMTDPWLRFLAKEYLAIYIFTVAMLALIDVRIVVYGFFLHVMYAFFSNGLINVVCHKYGYRIAETKDNSRNNLIVNALLFGSGIALHNTHHSQPKAYRLSRAWYEVDLIAMLIDVVRTRTV